MNKKILYISMALPYDGVRHAGGKTFNYYISNLANDSEYDVSLISKILPDERDYINKVNSNIKLYPARMSDNSFIKTFQYIYSINSKLNPFYKYGNVISKCIYNQITKILIDLKNRGYSPDVIILEWTWMLLYVDKVKKIFPNAIYLSSEHDVSFLGQQRKLNYGSTICKLIQRIKYKTLKKNELRCISECDLTFTHNKKDQLLLFDNGIAKDKVATIVPYYQTSQNKYFKSDNHNHDVIFYGAMNRMENEESCLWFINNVMPLLCKYDIRFIIVGNRPSKKLQNMQSDKIIVTGFVEDISNIFCNCMCAVVPLQYGAGIKVKVLEFMEMGVPVLTNNIGIEGIYATNNKEYIHCETPDQFANSILDLYFGNIDAHEMSINAVNFIDSNFNLKNSFDNYKNAINNLYSKKIRM